MRRRREKRSNAFAVEMKTNLVVVHHYRTAPYGWRRPEAPALPRNPRLISWETKSRVVMRKNSDALFRKRSITAYMVAMHMRVD